MQEPQQEEAAKHVAQVTENVVEGTKDKRDSEGVKVSREASETEP